MTAQPGFGQALSGVTALAIVEAAFGEPTLLATVTELTLARALVLDPTLALARQPAAPSVAPVMAPPAPTGPGGR
jgi:hypothetical protein